MEDKQQIAENLDIPEQGVDESKSSPFVTFLILVTIIVFLGTFLIYWLGVSKSSKIKTQDAKITDLQSQLSSKQMLETEKKLTLLEKQITGLKTANAQKIIWSKFFQELQAVTPKDVRYTNFNIDEKGTLTLSGNTVNFTALAKLLVSLRNSENLTDIKLTSSALQSQDKKTSVSFAITLKVQVNSLTEKPKGSSSSTSPSSSNGQSTQSNTAPASTQTTGGTNQ